MERHRAHLPALLVFRVEAVARIAEHRSFYRLRFDAKINQILRNAWRGVTKNVDELRGRYAPPVRSSISNHRPPEAFQFPR